jgi:pantoate--beta-alanine ligase
MAEKEIAAGERDAVRLVAAMREVLAAEPLAAVDYVDIVDADTLEPVTRLRRSCLALLAVFIGTTRLIDNMLIEERDSEFLASL